MNLVSGQGKNFYTMDVRAETLHITAWLLVNNYSLGTVFTNVDFENDFKQYVLDKYDDRLKVSNYPRACLNFLEYYGLITRNRSQNANGYVHTNSIVGSFFSLLKFASRSIENSAALFTRLLFKEFSNSESVVQDEISDLINKYWHNSKLAITDLEKPYLTWFSNRRNRDLKKHSKDTSQMFCYLLFSAAFIKNIFFTINVTSIYTHYFKSGRKPKKAWDEKKNIAFSPQNDEFFNIFFKVEKKNSKNKKAKERGAFNFEDFKSALKEIDKFLGAPSVFDGQKNLWTGGLEHSLANERPIEIAVYSNVSVYSRDEKQRELAENKYGRNCLLNLSHKSFPVKNGKIYCEFHHIFWLSWSKDQNEKALDFCENIIPLCAECHAVLHNADQEYKKSLLPKIWKILVERKLDKFKKVTEMFGDLSEKEFIALHENFLEKNNK